MAGSKPWPEVPVGNQEMGNTAVVIIGAGISGMCTAIDLIKRNNCKNFIILEKSGGIGGTWHDNKYPGCCCDVWSQLYSYSFNQKSDWTREYPGQEEILSYLVSTAQQYNLYSHIRFNSTVEDASWDDAAQKWKTRVTTTGKDAEFNAEYTITSDFLVSAVGQLNVPKWPETIPGLKEFKGKLMHSARWDWSYDLNGKKIGIIGNGATASQIIPEIAKVASHVTVFQRSPNWVIPRGDAPISPFVRGLYKYVPPIRWRKRAWQMDFRESFYEAVIDGEAPMAGDLRTMCIDQMHDALPNQPELWKDLTPTYNPGCKRVIISDDYYPTLARDNVDLETSKISRVTEDGIETEGGGTHDFDLIVCATGFKTVDFMHPIELHGTSGRALSDIWKRGARAFNGVTVEDLPNFGMLYGPNSNLGHNSIILMIEAQSRYVNGLITPVLEARKQGKSLSLRPKLSRLDEYNDKVQAVLRNSSFADPKCNSWYKNEAGLITNNWSGTVIDYQKMLAKVEWEDYEVEGSGSTILWGKKETKIGRVIEESRVSDATLGALAAVSMALAAAGWMARNSKYVSSWRIR
ncbi:hypothetical protein MBLNU459_g7497t1 [Dothideomycetes sp. NU459]